MRGQLLLGLPGPGLHGGPLLPHLAGDHPRHGGDVDISRLDISRVDISRYLARVQFSHLLAAGELQLCAASALCI